MDRDVTNKNIPLDDKFNKKNIDDRIYSFMQLHSYKGIDAQNNEIYFVYKREYNYSVISSKLNIENKTVSRKIGKLIDAGYIEISYVYTKDGTELVPCYKLNKLEKFQKINYNTLKFLLSKNTIYCIKVYAYLLNGIYKNCNYQFSYKELIQKCLGLKSTTHIRDYKIIKNCLNILIESGLLKLKLKKLKKYINGKTTYFFVIDEIKTKVKEI